MQKRSWQDSISLFRNRTLWLLPIVCVLLDVWLATPFIFLTFIQFIPTYSQLCQLTYACAILCPAIHLNETLPQQYSWYHIKRTVYKNRFPKTAVFYGLCQYEPSACSLILQRTFSPKLEKKRTMTMLIPALHLCLMNWEMPRSIKWRERI